MTQPGWGANADIGRRLRGPPIVVATGIAHRADPEAIVVNLRDRIIHRGGNEVAFRFRTGRYYQGWRLMVSVLVHPGVITYNELSEEIWGGREDGGPEDWRNSIFVMRNVANHKLAPIGLFIGTRPQHGLEMRDIS